MIDGLRSLFCPRSIAVVGASASPGKAGNAMVRSLLGFPGVLHLVNRTATEIEGRPVARSVVAIGEPVDLAVLVVPAEAVPAALEDCGLGGARAAVICAGGFAEAGEGRALQDEALAVARRHGIRLLGPNTSGFMNPVDGVMANFVPHVTRLEPGPASIVASSGGVNLAVSFLAADEGLGLRLGIGLGNAADVGFAEVLELLAHDDATRVVGLHLEGVDDGRALYDAVARVCEAKPVVALKVGQSDVDEFARSHTGRLLGDYALSRAALHQAGAVLVEDVAGLVDAMRALTARRVRPTRTPGVGVVTAQAGPGLLVTDVLRSRGVSVPPLADPTLKGLARLLPPLTWISNPVDTGRPTEAFGQVLALVANDDAVDALLVYALEEGDAVDPEVAFRTPGVAGELPVLFGTGGPREALDLRQRALGAMGIPLFRTPERAARAACALVEDARAQARRQSSAPVPLPSVPAFGPEALDEHDSKLLLQRLGVSVPERVACADRARAHEALTTVGGRAVVKVLDPAVPHKAAVGGVHLGVDSPERLDRALDRIDAIATSSSRGYLVEAQIDEGRELLVGGLRDEVWGPVVALGRGGVDVEAHAPSWRLVPLSDLDLAELVAEVDEALDPAVVGPVVRAVVALLMTDDDVVEVDVNPVRITSAGAIALDALVVRSTDEGKA